MLIEMTTFVIYKYTDNLLTLITLEGKNGYFI